jgi:hypothetical protein
MACGTFENNWLVVAHRDEVSEWEGDEGWRAASVAGHHKFLIYPGPTCSEIPGVAMDGAKPLTMVAQRSGLI